MIPVPWIAAGAALALGISGTLWYRAQYADCKAAAAETERLAQEKINTARASDAALTRAIEEKLAPVTRALQEQVDETRVALARVPSNPACSRTPAAVAFDRGVRLGTKSANSPPAGAAGARTP